MAGEGKFAVNVESIYIETPEGIMTLIDYLQHTRAGDVDWDGLAGKPSEFPPSAHEHDAGDVTSGVLDTARVPSLPQSKVSGLAGALDGKADAATVEALEQRIAALEAEPEA